MGFFDALIHVGNFFLPSVGIGAIGAALAKLVWRQDLANRRWLRLAASASCASALVSVLGLVVFDRDGRMAGYGAMVVAASVALLWSGFGPGRR